MAPAKDARAAAFRPETTARSRLGIFHHAAALDRSSHGVRGQRARRGTRKAIIGLIAGLA